MVSDLNETLVKELCDMGASSGSYADIARECDLIITILPTGAIVREVLFGENGVASALTAGKVVCDMSSVTPVSLRSATAVSRKSAWALWMLPSPAASPAPSPALWPLCAAATRRTSTGLKPVFEIMGSSALLIGSSGAGSVTKLANQIMVNLNIAAVSEALVLATRPVWIP